MFGNVSKTCPEVPVQSPSSSTITTCTSSWEIDLLVPNVEAGNALVKMMIYFMGACAAGVVVGGKVPVVITSRSDDATARLASIAAAVVSLDWFIIEKK